MGNSSAQVLLQSAYRYAQALCSNADAAEDLVHEGWLKLMERRSKQPDRALLFTVIRNLYIDDYRHRQRFPSEPIDDIELIDYAAIDPVDNASEDRLLAAALHKLGDNEREVLFLSVFEGYTAAEIATLTAQSRGTVLSQIHRARSKLKLWLSQGSGPSLTLVPDKRAHHE